MKRRFFVRRIRILKGFPFTYKTWTQEMEPPYRRGDTRVVRMPFRRGLAFGKWTGHAESEDHALVSVLSKPKPFIPGRDTWDSTS